MVIYEVNIEVDRSVAADYEAWIPSHMKELLTFDGFLKAQVYRIGGADEATHDGICWSFHFHLRDEAALKAYFQDHAPRLRQESKARFRGLFTASRRVLFPTQDFVPA